MKPAGPVQTGPAVACREKYDLGANNAEVFMYGEWTRRRRNPAGRIGLYLLTIILFVMADQAVKMLVLRTMKDQDIPVLGNILHFTYAENTGAAFSLLQGKIWLLSAATAVMVSVCLFLLLTRRFDSKLCNVALALIISGGIGNLIDRIFRHYVVDFIYFKIINFADFNLADSYVVVGAVLLCLYLIRAEAKDRGSLVK